MNAVVCRVRAQEVLFPQPHQHVTHVMLNNESVEPREQVLERLKRGTRYRTGASRVSAGPCQRCSMPNMLRTQGRANLLLLLERF